MLKFGLVKKFVFTAFFVCLAGAMGFALPNNAENAVKQQITVEPVRGLSDDFMRGVDISSLLDIEKAGGKFYNSIGNEDDLFRILKQNGVNWVRLRVWNNPVYERNLMANGKVIAKKGDAYGGGNNSVDVDVELAKRAKAAGLKLLVDFHYSDSWADPAKQKMPQDWKSLSEKELNKAVEKFTKESLEKFIKAGARPDMVQIGNELNDGFMWPVGRIWGSGNTEVGGMDSFISLLKSAAKGVRGAQGKGEKIKICVHLADGGKNELYRSIFDPITASKLDYDVIGLSYYSYWHGSIEDLKLNMQDLSRRYKKELVVVETAYGFTEEDGDDQGNVFQVYSDETNGYVPSVQGQATAIRDVIEAVASVSGGNGVFYWEPAWIPVKGAGLSATEGDTWENQCMFDFKGRVLPSMAVWNLVYGRGAVTNIWGGSAKVATGAAVPYGVAEEVVVKTQPGTKPVLPAKVKLVLSDDSEALVSVTWENHDWSKETKLGSVLVNGTANGSGFRVVAKVEITNEINLIEDASFESGKLGEWKLNGPSKACFVESNKSNARTGAWTYKYWLDTPFKSTLTRTFKDLPNGTYRFSLWAMGGGNDNAIRIFATGHDGSSKQISAEVVNTGWKVWKQYSIEIPVSSGEVTLGIYIDSASGCWGNFDDFEFVKE